MKHGLHSNSDSTYNCVILPGHFIGSISKIMLLVMFKLLLLSNHACWPDAR